MNTELARTFLVVIATGSFVDASQRLHVTQSTVSTRIQRLEEALGAELFVRNKAGTTLTPAGQQFQRHAALLTRTVEQARQEIGIVSGYHATLTVGGRIGLWEDLLLRWLPIFASFAPDVAVRALIGSEEDLMQALIDGRSNIGVMNTPQARPGLTVEPLLEEQLVMVSTQADQPPEPTSDYIYVDWGTDFFAQHCLAFPNFAGAALTINDGSLGLQRLLAYGGTGYFPVRMLRGHERTGRVRRVAGAPEFRLPAYLCFPTKLDSEPLSLALDTIRRVAAETSGAHCAVLSAARRPRLSLNAKLAHVDVSADRPEPERGTSLGVDQLGKPGYNYAARFRRPPRQRLGAV
ncbi:MAG: LysR family transcriptional regulator [Steroidobacteraceae bacterium]